MFRREFRIDPVPAQQVLPRGGGIRFEGLGYSPAGDILAAATADTHTAWLFRRGADGRFPVEPFCTLNGLHYPHDVSFATSGPLKGMLAVAQREGAVSLFSCDPPGAAYGPAPVFEIAGPESRLVFSDAVSFVPPHNDYLAACNLTTSTVGFYSLHSHEPLRFATAPDFELKHDSMVQPDGLGFSDDGEWLATANHGGGNVTVFRRASRAAAGEPLYGPEPALVIEDADFRYPHSVAFTRNGNLVMTDAGANHLKVFRLARGWFAKETTVTGLAKLETNDDAAFHDVNATNKMEGGPKGLAIHGRELAVCSPEFGIKIYSFRE